MCVIGSLICNQNDKLYVILMIPCIHCKNMTCYFDNCICYQNCNCDMVLRDDAWLVPCDSHLQGFSEFLQHYIRPQNSVTSLYGIFRAEKLPYEEVTELWGLMQCCKDSAKPCMGNVGNAAFVEYSTNWNSASVQWSLPL